MQERPGLGENVLKSTFLNGSRSALFVAVAVIGHQRRKSPLELKSGERRMRESNTYSMYQAIIFYRCIACNRETYLDKRIVDNKGRMIALERFSPQQHIDMHGKQLK